MAIFIESETMLMGKFINNKTSSTKTQQHNKGKDSTLRKTLIDLTNWRHDNWKRLNKIEMAHPLAKVFSWAKSLKHTPSFDLASSMESWLGNHPTINQVLNLMLQLKEIICLVSYLLVKSTILIHVPSAWDWNWKKSRFKWLKVTLLK